jgi:hypothetical protein
MINILEELESISFFFLASEVYILKLKNGAKMGNNRGGRGDVSCSG